MVQRDRNSRINRDENRINTRDQHLFRLSELDDYKVASGDPDVRGWAVFGSDHRELGTINELVVDPDREKVRYLDVVPSRTRPDETAEHHLLIPIGVARLDEREDRVVVDEIDREWLDDYPVYRSEWITRDHENEVIGRFNTMDTGTTNRTEAGDFYDSRLYDEDRFYSARNKDRRV